MNICDNDIYNIQILILLIVSLRVLLPILLLTDFFNELPGKSCVNTLQQATIGEAVLSVDPTDRPIDWLGSDHVICLL
jgi:hypothetical protein